RAVIAEKALPGDNEANTDGNRHFYGFECENLGDGDDPWPAVQLEAIERAAAALCRHHGWNERSVIGHLEWQPGKVDPRGFTMASMRERIRDRLK
ncbi:N-acetylmuramoyl-L-alanine amidase, partial [Streptomyces tendae]